MSADYDPIYTTPEYGVQPAVQEALARLHALVPADERDAITNTAFEVFTMTGMSAVDAINHVAEFVARGEKP